MSEALRPWRSRMKARLELMQFRCTRKSFNWVKSMRGVLENRSCSKTAQNAITPPAFMKGCLYLGKGYLYGSLSNHFSPTSNIIITSNSGKDETVTWWDWTTGKAVKTIEPVQQGPTMRSKSGTPGDLLKVLEGHTGATERFAFSKNGSLLASSSLIKQSVFGTFQPIYRACLLWDLHVNYISMEVTKSYMRVFFSPDGKLLAAAAHSLVGLKENYPEAGLSSESVKGVILIWNLSKGELSMSQGTQVNSFGSLSFAQAHCFLPGWQTAGLRPTAITAIRSPGKLGQVNLLADAKSQLIGGLYASSDGTVIETSMGRFDIRSFYPGREFTSHLDFAAEENWILACNEKILLLHDSHVTCATAIGDLLIMVHKPGRVSFLQVISSEGLMQNEVTEDCLPESSYSGLAILRSCYALTPSLYIPIDQIHGNLLKYAFPPVPYFTVWSHNARNFPVS
ncbi:hypothetical protein TSTA_039280 [Talaromyces stipitatus ATCC 10500]|uniref:Uncharacterized protein n=1 Tax=Talaromyces stipitatus (strain ATCC 10500 / CBS 375.48 / QM 6759 / NRRL 1006) TaxID=441959 RepID=B8M3Y4_TALSN|nr:uncharacterized protein TSTA_039280 [Talaromyces stipitatus ATCC 10500]EED20727.1 hypothetical protein TSTA_039280 [Talaromyces stipitatus ATCC 10500]